MAHGIALQRVKSLKQTKSKAIGERLYIERKRFELKAQKMRECEEARKREMIKIFDVKLELAEMQRKLLHLKLSNEKKKKVRLDISIFDSFVFIPF